MIEQVKMLIKPKMNKLKLMEMIMNHVIYKRKIGSIKAQIHQLIISLRELKIIYLEYKNPNRF